MKTRKVAGLAVLALVATGVCAYLIHARHTRSPMPFSACTHIKDLIHAEATHRMLEPGTPEQDTLALVEAVNQINKFDLQKCTARLDELREAAPVLYSAYSRCVMKATDTTTAGVCSKERLTP